MDSTDSPRQFDKIVSLRKLLLIRGVTMLVLGVLLAILSAATPGVIIMSEGNSWLPFVAMLLLLVGALECFDTYLSRGSDEFLINLQLAVFDCVIGLFILFGLDDDPMQLTMVVAAFMITKGLFRVIAVSAVKVENSMTSTVIGGLISVVLGFAIWAQWPFSAAWFVSLCLSIEVALRGWALAQFAVWLKTLEISEP